MRVAESWLWTTFAAQPARKATLLLLGVFVVAQMHAQFLIAAAPFEARFVRAFGQALEARFAQPVLSSGARIDGIIVLGGSPTRVRAALDLAQRFPDAPIILSGPGEAEIAVARDVLGQDLRLMIDRRATTTYENALFSKDLVRPAAGQCWAVVTSAVHMPRSVGAFHAVGFPVLPWPVSDTPTTPAALSTWVWHEVLGLAGYWALGRSDALYPVATHECGSTQIAGR